MTAKPERGPSLPRFVLQLALVLAGVGAAAFVFQNWLSTEARLQKILSQEARAMAAADAKTFLALQDPTDADWWAHQESEIDRRVTGNLARAAAAEPPPRSRVVSIEVQGEIASALIDVGQAGGAARQIAFFRQTDDGWLHTGTRAAFFGALARTQSRRLAWVYRERDAEWVTGLLGDGEAMAAQLGEDFGVGWSQPMTVEVSYRLYSWPEPDSTRPVLLLPSALVIGADEQAMRYALGSALVQYVSLRHSGWRVLDVTDSRGLLLGSIMSWETSRVTGAGLHSQAAQLLAEAIAAGNLPGLDRVWPEPGSSTEEAPGLRSAAGWTVLDYIAARYGVRTVTELAGRLRTVPTAQDCLQTVLQMDDLSELQAGWLQFVRDRYGRKE